MLKEVDRPTFSPSQMAYVRAELEFERRRLERALADDTSSAEHDEILRAIRRLGDGTYGICAACSQPIPYDRLSVVPTTEHCMGCPA